MNGQKNSVLHNKISDCDNIETCKLCLVYEKKADFAPLPANEDGEKLEL